MARKNVDAIQFLVPGGARDKINDFAARQGYNVISDYLRHLVERDMQAHGESIDLDVQRGRYPRTSEDAED